MKRGAIGPDVAILAVARYSPHGVGKGYGKKLYIVERDTQPFYVVEHKKARTRQNMKRCYNTARVARSV